MSENNLRFAEAWFRLLSEAARGTRAAQATIRSLAEGRVTPQSVARQIARFLPTGGSPPTAETLQEWTEELWAAIGVVPRSRYVELLERYEALRGRLEEAEVTIRRLKRLLSESGHEGDAQKVLDLWSNAVGETLRSQADWMRTWMGGAPPPVQPRARKPTGERRPRGRRAARPRPASEDS
jgi:hypothetical protein